MGRLLAALALVSTICPAGPQEPLPRATYVAHRGNSSEAPENTLAAVRSALALEPPPDYVEIDVHASKDGRLVVIHDKTLERTTDATGVVKELSFAEIRRASAGYASEFGDAFATERVPELAEVLAEVEDTSTAIMIEVKARKLGEPIVRLLEERDEIDRHVIASFTPSVLVDAKMANPNVRTLYLCGELEPEEVELARLIGADIVGASRRGVPRTGTQAAHASGLKVWVYTVNDPPFAADLLRRGADGIISDRVGAMPRTQ